ncbi:uncharacterized protein LOC131680295 [Topomyia yanbarensis]|uniref:uncharacterized protein LOC131680295 n=1 Tax=Topomyia yanbarensis TaxID=2498891 RepID=UPI00273B6103|nr:uncharacterized protein LOC131680295 [Topomyia yanbarensis]
MLATEAISRIGNWMQGMKLQIAQHKTEVLLVSICKVLQRLEITVGEHVIVSKRALKQLGVMLDDCLNFNTHVDYACEKPAKRFIENHAEQRRARQQQEASSGQRIIVDTEMRRPVWVAALETQRNRTKLSSTFRLMAMRLSSAYRTISSEAVFVIAGTIPIGTS